MQKIAQALGRSIPSRADDRQPRRRWCGRDLLQASHTSLRSSAHLAGHLRCGSRERLEVLGLDPQHARRLCGTKADEERRVEHDRNLAKHFARLADADDEFRALDELRDFHATFQQDEQDATRVTLVNCVLPGEQPEVGAGVHQMVELLVRKLGEDGNETQFIAGEHRRSSGTRDVSGGDSFQREPVANALVDDTTQLLRQGNPRVAGSQRRKLGDPPGDLACPI